MSVTAPSSDLPVRSTERFDWVDGAKAIAIVLVVLYHVGNSGMSWLMPEGRGPGISMWITINDALATLRMPLFFVVSGLLASTALERPWSQLVRPRITALIWPFAIWTLLFAPPYTLYRGQMSVSEGFVGALLSIPLGGTGYWYLYVLVVFFVVCRVFRQFGYILVVGGLLALAASPALVSIASALFPAPFDIVFGNTVARLCAFFLWFAVGCFAPKVVQRIAEAGYPLLIASGVGFAALTVLHLLGRETGSARSLALSVTGITLALIGSRLIARWQPAARLGRYLAARTLAIYVVHPFALAIVIWVTLRFSAGTGVPLGFGAEWWLTPVLTIALVALSCLAYDIAMRSPLRYLFVPPGAARVRTRM